MLIVDGDLLEVALNLDDMSPELCQNLLEKLLQIGCNDVWWSNIFMKKGRPAIRLQLLCRQALLPEVEEVLFTETTSFGFRYTPVSRHRLEPEFHTVNTEYGMVQMKVGRYEGKIVQFAPEYEDCLALAKAKHVALKEVFAAANQAFLDLRPHL